MPLMPGPEPQGSGSSQGQDPAEKVWGPGCGNPSRMPLPTIWAIFVFSNTQK